MAYRSDTLRDFSASPRLLLLAGMALIAGTTGAFAAFVLLKLIALFTNLAYLQRLSFDPIHLIGNDLPLWTVAIPVIGSIVIGLMARFGSEKIRGHGIPEAIEAILIGQRRIEPKVAILKPLSSAIAIGTGGPFGAEGPIIMTGGALSSLFAQLFDLSSAERKTLLRMIWSAIWLTVWLRPTSGAFRSSIAAAARLSAWWRGVICSVCELVFCVKRASAPACCGCRCAPLKDRRPL